MRLLEVTLLGYRSVKFLQFQVAPLTVLFGKNNSGKTNVLEAVYGVLAPDALSPENKGRTPARGVSHPDYLERVAGWVVVQLDADLPFDRGMLELRTSIDPDDPYGGISLPGDQAAFISHHDEYAGVYMRSGFTFAELSNLLDRTDPRNVKADLYDLDFKIQSRPRARPLFLNWDIDGIGERVIAELIDGEVVGRHPFYPEYADPWVPDSDVLECLESFAALATRFLPDFLDGAIGAHVHVPNRWGDKVRLGITYRERGSDPSTGRRIDDTNDISELGGGSSRWVAVAIQMALHVITQSDIQPGPSGVKVAPEYSGHILFLDEPEAHLHPSAVASIVRWCKVRIDDGFNIVLATHHEQFLRMASEDVALVHITRDVGDPSRTQARTQLSSATPLLQELAKETGMHPATVMSLHRAVLFVEGTLDVAVLQELAGFSLDAAGVLIIPIGGTNNLYGLVDGEFAPRLGMKVGVLTDNTVVATMDDRSRGKYSHEERKLVRLLERFEETGATPPKLFGVPEDDLIHALPSVAIREHFNQAFPGWKELVDEWRAAKTAMPQAPRSWKAYAETTYGLQINKPDGVREIVHNLDLAGVELPSVRCAVDAIINWARES